MIEENSYVSSENRKIGRRFLEKDLLLGGHLKICRKAERESVFTNCVDNGVLELGQSFT